MKGEKRVKHKKTFNCHPSSHSTYISSASVTSFSIDNIVGKVSSNKVHPTASRCPATTLMIVSLLLNMLCMSVLGNMQNKLIIFFIQDDSVIQWWIFLLANEIKVFNVSLNYSSTSSSPSFTWCKSLSSLYTFSIWCNWGGNNAFIPHILDRFLYL